MQVRTRHSLPVTLLLLVIACAHQEDPGEIMGDDDEDGGSLNLGGKASGGSGSGGSGGSGQPALGGTGNPSKGGSGGKGGGTALPPAGSVGGKGGKGGGGSGGSSGSGGSDDGGTSGSGGGGSGGGGTVHMPVEGLSMTFKPDSTTSEVDWLGGEILFSNDSTESFALADLKIRYYFTNEIASPTTEVRWAQFGPVTNMGNMNCQGTIETLPTAKAGADSYVEITCAAGDMTAATALKTSWRAGANGGGIFKLQQADDYSFSAPEHIVVLHGGTVIWGTEP